MKKYFAYTALALVLIIGTVLVIYVGVQPRAIPKIKLSGFQTTKVVANSVLLSLGHDISAHSLVLWGLEPGKPDLVQTLQDFIALNQDPKTAYQVFLVDQDLEILIPELKAIPGERFDLKTDFDRLQRGLQQFASAKTRVMVILAPPFAAAYLAGSAAANLKAQGVDFISLLFVGFPRTRDAEKNLSIPCDVADHDMTGTGKLGCEIVTTARMNYRKTFHPGDLVGVMNQVSQNDFLFMLTREQ